MTRWGVRLSEYGFPSLPSGSYPETEIPLKPSFFSSSFTGADRYFIYLSKTDNGVIVILHTPSGKPITPRFRLAGPIMISYRTRLRKHNQYGATVLELVAAMLCLTLLYAFVFHHGHIWLNERYAYQARLELIQLIEHARLRSLRGGISLTLCGTKDFQACDDDWSGGVLLSTFQHTGRQNFPLTLRLQKTLHLYGPRHSLEFFPDPAANVLNGTFVICTPHGVGFPVIVNRVGRSRMLFPAMDERCQST